MKPEELIGKTVEILDMCGGCPDSGTFPFHIGSKLKVINAIISTSTQLCLWLENMPYEWFARPGAIKIIEDDYDGLVQEALRRYPAGTKVTSLSFNKKELTVTGNLNMASLTTDRREERVWIDTDGVYRALVYEKGKWAEIIPPDPTEPISPKAPKLRGQALLDEVNRRYPIGTRYHPLTCNGNQLPRIEEATKAAKFVTSELDNYVEVGIDYVYVNGKWAEVVELPTAAPAITSTPTQKVSTDLTPEDIIEEIRRRYPVGTRYYPLDSFGNEILTPFTVSKLNAGISLSDGVAWACYETGSSFVYHISTKKWARILEESVPSAPAEEPSKPVSVDPREELHKEVARRYPIGTRYTPLDHEGEKMDRVYTVVRHQIQSNDFNAWIDDSGSSAFVYHIKSKRWAEVVGQEISQPEVAIGPEVTTTPEPPKRKHPTKEQLEALYRPGTEYYYVCAGSQKGSELQQIPHYSSIKVRTNSMGRVFADHLGSSGYVYDGEKYAIILINGQEFNPNAYPSVKSAIEHLDKIRYTASISETKQPKEDFQKEPELKIPSKDKTLDTSVPKEIKLNGDVQEESQQFYF